MGKRLRTIIFALLLMPWLVSAMWMTQEIELTAGWNAVYVQVQPVPASCDTIFDGLSVDRVIMWDRSVGGVEYLSDVSEELPRSPDWLVWRPASAPESELNTLAMFLAGESYLIHMNEAATLQLKGRAELVHPRWIPNEMTLTGLPVDSNVSFADYFSHTDDIGVDSSDGGAIYEILEDGSERLVYRPSLVSIHSGESYWIKTGQTIDYDGSLEVSFSDGGDFVDFGSRMIPRRIRLKNNTDESRTVTLELMNSETPPMIDGEPVENLQGRVPLSFVQFNAETRQNEYVPMPDLLVTNVAARSTCEITIIPRANEMQSASPDAVWGSLLKVSDGGVVQFAGVRCMQEEAAFADPAGLWIGNVAVTAVSRAPSRIGATNVWDTVTPVPVSRPYTFRVLLHVSSAGECRLLQRAIPAWIPGAEGEAPEAHIFTDADDALQFRSDHPDAEMRRISSATFPLMDPLSMTGDFGSSDGLECTVVLPYDDSVNPFVHPFHPDHDNQEIRNGVALPLGEGDEAFDVTRVLQFSFLEDDPLGANPNWRVSEHGGVFSETVDGLNKTIYVQGAFRLEKVSDCGVLSYLDL